MKSSLRLAIILFIATLPCVAQVSGTGAPLINRITGQPAASSPAPDKGLIVHEWGTFTTMQGSDGSQLSGLYLEEESLPKFVYHHEGFAPDPFVTDKGLYKPVLQATVKMETPVLYFYAPEHVENVSVHVDFPPGTISQWYPQRSAGEANNIQDYLDLTQPYNGWIEWQAEILSPGVRIGTTAPHEQETHTWTAPRATDANMVRTQGSEVEHFLFYRGLANFTVPLHVAFNAAGELVITNNGEDNIPYALVYDSNREKPYDIWWTGPIAAGEHRTVSRLYSPSTDQERQQYMAEFEDALVAAGLYRKEAAAMLDTWNQSYFNTPGLRVFWIVPRSFTDRILPLDIQPAPQELERVLVGRSEIMTPTLEKELVHDFSNGDKGKWAGDRYLFAYEERVERVTAQTATTPADLRSTEMLHAAFNSNETLEINGRFETLGETRIRVTNVLGQQVALRTETAHSGIVRSIIEASELPSGIYFLTVQMGNRQWVRKIVKE